MGSDGAYVTTVPDPNGGDWRSSFAIGWESGTGNRQLMRRSGTQMPSKLRLCRMMKSIREILRCQAVKTVIAMHKQERTAWILSAKRPSASEVGVGVAWCDRTLMTRRWAVRLHSSLTPSAKQGVMECRPVLSCNSPAVVAPHTTPWTGRQSRYRAADAQKLT